MARPLALFTVPPNSNPFTALTEPVHQQLARACRVDIASGRLRPHDRFPSERDIAGRYKVSRATANKVISQMVAEGMLVLRPGIGTFVAPVRGLHASLRQMESFTAAARSAGLIPATEVLCLRKERAHQIPGPVRKALGLDGRASVYYCERLRVADNEPVILEHRWVRADLVPGLSIEQLSGSFYHYLELTHGIFLTGERHKIHAWNLTAVEARKFRLATGSAVLVVEGPGFTEVQTPVWYQILYYRGDRYELQNEVQVVGGLNKLTVQRREPEAISK